ncbi:MAG TPA: lipid-A-disaccharide synthase [Candidatus Acidoferrales bacterium]|nr:lipid-A-disaccharide synthase [Candidatus Acidoferrales bacterium]
MDQKTFMIIAGESSGDLLAAELVSELREKSPGAKFFGVGGEKMAANGVETVYDMSQLAVVGLTDVFKKVLEFRRLLKQLLAEAIKRKPDVVIGVDYGGFNLRFGHAVKEYLRENPFTDWKPKVVQFISPQVWASRPKRADRMAPDYDLLLSIFPFEKEWYAKRVPQLRVEFVGHPMVDRFTNDDLRFMRRDAETASNITREPRILLLPGSRRSELRQHLPAMLGALKLIREKIPQVKASMVVPGETTARLARTLGADMEIQTGNIPAALAATDVAMAKTGTVTMECAFFRVPTVTFYKGSWINYQIARHYITVKTFTMANLLAGEEVYPEFLQQTLTAENLARATLELLQSEPRRAKMRAQLDKVIASLGEPGATRRAADAILSLLK